MTDEQEKMNEAMQEMLNNPFYSLVFSLGNSALISLGKIPNPMTNQEEKDLNQAKITIDMLSMLKEKTEGNLDAQEKQFLHSQVAELQLLYATVSKGDE